VPDRGVVDGQRPADYAGGEGVVFPDGAQREFGGTPDGPRAERGKADGPKTADGPKPDGPAAASFRFVSWADAKSSGWATQQKLSPAIKAKNPALVVYPGDLCDSGPSASCLDQWKASYNGGSAKNGLFDITFASRGNHDGQNAGAWQSYFNFAAVAAKVGATQYSEQSADLTYSFDYKNSHFVALDAPGGAASSIDTALAAWLDKDLTAAEGRGLTHAFLFFHGPPYYVDGHSDSGLKPAFITVFNKHPIISAVFNGHEHVQGYVHVDSKRISAVTHAFEEFVTGGAGAGLYSCASGRSDWCKAAYGYSVVDVNGKSFTVSNYVDTNANPDKTWTFTKP
jgi:hypothetical protein